MTIAVTDYTDSDKIRARMGVDIADVDDDTLASFQLDIQLELSLANYQIDAAGIKTAYDADTADPAKRKSWYLLQLYAGSFCAAKTIRGRDLLFPMLFKDGKAESRRFAKLSITDIADALEAEAAKWLDELLADQALDPVAAPTVYSPVLVVPPTADPVTNT